jgi:hypothetical protein
MNTKHSQKNKFNVHPSVFHCLNDFQKDLKLFENDIFIFFKNYVHLYTIICYNIFYNHKIFFKIHCNYFTTKFQLPIQFSISKFAQDVQGHVTHGNRFL